MAELERRASSEWVSEVYFAWTHIGLGENGKALDWLERACDERIAHVLWLRASAAYDPLRCEPRYRQLLARLNLLPSLAKPQRNDHLRNSHLS